MMTTTQKHTPTPWKLYTGKLRPQFSADVIEIRARGRYPVISWLGFDESAIHKNRHLANAAFIVLAVNNFDTLLEAAKAGLAVLYAAQVEWADVLPPYAPEWTYPLKDAAEDLEAAIAAVEGATP